MREDNTTKKVYSDNQLIISKLKIKNTIKVVLPKIFSRDEGIRTPDTLLYTRFPSVRLKPLGHVSVNLYWKEDYYCNPSFSKVRMKSKNAKAFLTFCS